METQMKKAFFAVLVSLAIVLCSAALASAMEVEKVNINSDSVEKLMTLERVGPKYAQRIVEYRLTHGPFEKPEDIMNVPGIGQQTWEANKDRIVI